MATPASVRRAVVSHRDSTETEAFTKTSEFFVWVIPETSKENEVMGETRDNLVSKAQEKAQETQEKVQQVAQEAQNQGLTNE